MKKSILLLALLFIGMAVKAQDVNIPDTVLKDKLLNHDPVIDTNGDGEIQVAEAVAFTGFLDVSSYSGPNILDITGLDAFTNITGLDLSANPLQTIDVSSFVQLDSLDLNYVEISSLDISSNLNLAYLSLRENSLSTLSFNHPSLVELRLNGNNFTEIDLNGMPNLEKLFIDSYFSSAYNNIEEIDFTPVSNLKELYMAEQGLTEIDVSMLPLLERLNLSENPLSAIDLSNNPALVYLHIHSAQLTELDVSANPQIEELSFSGNVGLTYVNLKNGSSEMIDLNEGFYVTPNIQTVCVDEVNELADWHLLQLQDIGAAVTTYCSFTPAQSNIVEGTLKFNTGDGCEAGTALVLPNTLVKTINGANSFGSITNSEGEYLIYTEEGVNTTVMQSDLPSYFTTSPGSHVSNFSGYGNTDTADFCMDSDQTIDDLNVVVFGQQNARPGRETIYEIVYENLGTTTLSGEITFEFDDAMQTFMGANPAESASTNNMLTFQFQDLGPLQSQTIEVEMHTFTHPTVQAGDILDFTASITPSSSDYTPENNVFNYNPLVVNSYDPNDKEVLQGNNISMEQAEDYLHYMIRFQNTGNASAIDIVVTDTLSNQLNWDSMRMVSASHDYRVQITNDNFVEFIFEGIDLPHEAADEAGSNGYVVYKIKPVDGLQVGDIVHGMEAGIYFDFNPPIITKEADTEIVEETASTEFFDFENSIKIHPNPSKGIVNISAGNGVEVQTVEVYSVSGQKLLQEQAVSSIDIGNLPQGLYFVKVYSAEGAEVVRKIIKN